MGEQGTSREPQIGLFWFVPDSLEETIHLMPAMRPARTVPILGGFRTLEQGHVELWPLMSGLSDAARAEPYEAFPRGRVNWRESDGRYLIVIGYGLDRPRFLNRIVETFALPAFETVVLIDPHYACPMLWRPPFARRED